jgi:hypothetical protein
MVAAAWTAIGALAMTAGLPASSSAQAQHNPLFVTTASAEGLLLKAGQPPKVAVGVRVGLKTPCQQVVFIGAQGSGENANQASGLGAPVYDAWLQYKNKLPAAALGYYAVPYPAAPADVASLLTKKYRATFYASIDAGVQETIQFLRSRRSCKSEHYVLAGYSQGAMAVERAAHWILQGKANGVPKSTIDRIDGLLLVASGDRIASTKNINYGAAPVSRSARGISHYAALLPSGVSYDYDLKGRLEGPRVHEVCVRGDVVCDTDLKRLSRGIKLHGSYSQWGHGQFAGDAVVFVRSAATNIAKHTRSWLRQPSFPGTETGRVSFTHPTWGPVTLVTSFQAFEPSDPYGSSGEGFITVSDAYGRTVWSHRTGDKYAWYEMQLHQPAMDSTGRVFIDWNPGRYNGVTVLLPIAGGFEDHDTLPDIDSYNGRFYYADVVDVNADGVFEVAQHANDCRPSCAGGTITTQNFYWTGSGYVAR